ncbi:MAG: epoxyqueuosine reductase QueH [Clostridia bacterium]|nr:epoxyqueuosine reductase QueH [Clostridia bacterium]
MKENYDKKMTETMRDISKGERLLLHSCCAPCSSACLERLKEVFKVTVLYYNPNIDDEEEYEKRKAEQIRFLKETGWADFIDCDYEREAFEEIARGLEAEPERGKRCYLCYALRLDKTAKLAKENGFLWFTSTLSVSPYKSAAWLNELGERAAEKYGVGFLNADFKKQGGYYRSEELSREYGLYRQDYCGCRFSKAEAEKKRREKKREN